MALDLFGPWLYGCIFMEAEPLPWASLCWAGSEEAAQSTSKRVCGYPGRDAYIYAVTLLALLFVKDSVWPYQWFLVMRLRLCGRHGAHSILDHWSVHHRHTRYRLSPSVALFYRKKEELVRDLCRLGHCFQDDGWVGLWLLPVSLCS